MSHSHTHPDFKKYKFKELKTYADTEWLAGNRKKYRQVFDKHHTSYIYAELAFYNKLFDVSVWEVEIELKCFQSKDKQKQICDLKLNKKISKYDNVVYMREGWGNKKSGAFWKKGSYYWEAWIEGELVATKYFYVEDIGFDYLEEENPYFVVNALKLYEGQFDDINSDEHQSLRVFSQADTRYVHVDIELENFNADNNWHCELFVNFYNEARELKGRIVRLLPVAKKNKLIKTSAGWGSNTPGSWRKGEYSIEIVFFDRMIAQIPFEIDDVMEEGVPDIKLPYQADPIDAPGQEEIKESFDELFDKLNSLVGLDEIKEKVKDHSDYIKFIQLRKDKGFDEANNMNIHSVFTGNPGTGKTTVAMMMGKLYKKMGLLAKGHVHEVDRVDLVGEYIGQTAPKVKEAIEKARGGVLFIDEAYALARSNDDTKDFGREVIEILVKEMSNGTNDFAVIVAGYPAEMKNFINSNPGLKSRFKHFFEFKDYLPQELIAIAELAVKEKQVKLNPDAMTLMEEIIVKEFRKRDKTFGNARFVHDLVDKAKINLGLRIMKRKNPQALPPSDLETIIKADVKRIILERSKEKPNIPVDEKHLAIALEELNSLIGIEEVKKQIFDLVEIIKFHRKKGRSVVANYSFHTVFVGNPGTGKTTVARILTNIYKSLGILERGHIVETDRQGLVAGYIGQTAIKTTERIDEAMGGVLFIDEAYSLSNFNGLQGDYGNEAIQTILKRMEDDRGEFYVFVAGYPGNMDKFLKANPGLSSRFDKTLVFDDYTPEELVRIGDKIIKDEGMRMSRKAKLEFSKVLHELHNFKDQYFGNARTVRKLILELINIQNHRLATMEGEASKRVVNLITEKDIEKLSIKDDTQSLNRGKMIGF